MAGTLTPEQAAIMLSMLKVDLGILGTTAYDERLAQLLEASAESITREGAALDLAAVLDQELVVEYAAWLWRRRDSHAGMGDGLRYRLNCRVLGEKARAVNMESAPDTPSAQDSGTPTGGGGGSG